MIKAFVFRFFIVFLTTLGVILLMPGITIQSRPAAFLFVLIIAGFNASLKIFLTLISAGCSIIALGPILLIGNTMMLWIVSFIPLGIVVDNFWAAFWGGLIISVVAFVMSLLVSDGL